MKKILNISLFVMFATLSMQAITIEEALEKAYEEYHSSGIYPEVETLNLNWLEINKWDGFATIRARFPNLKVLGLSGNYLKDIPGDIRRLGLLRELNLNNNDITAEDAETRIALLWLVKHMNVVSLKENNISVSALYRDKEFALALKDGVGKINFADQRNQNRCRCSIQ